MAGKKGKKEEKEGIEVKEEMEVKLSTADQAAAGGKAEAVKAKPARKRREKRKTATTKSKKKRATARAIIKKGSGRVVINKRSLGIIEPLYAQQLIREPLMLAGGLAGEVDISVNVKGGGNMGQVVSARGAVAKALVKYSKDDKLRQRFLGYDRTLLVDDIRKTEPKKPLGPKARRKKQKSKR